MSVVTAKTDLPSDTKNLQHIPVRPVASVPADVEPDARQVAAALGQSAKTQAQTMHAQARSGIERAVTFGERFVTFGQANTAAVMEASRIWFAGCHAMSHEVTSITQEAYRQNLGLFSSFAAVRTHQDAVTLHATSVRSMMDKATQNTARLTETSIKLAEQSFAPIAARIDAAVSLASATRL